MIRPALSALSAIALVAVTGGVARGDKYSDKQIMPKHENVGVWVGSERVGTEVNFGWPTTVKRVNGQWLWIEDDGSYNVERQGDRWVSKPIQGWISKNDVVLLEDDPVEKQSALEYFTGRVRRNPDAAWAHWLRGVVLADRSDFDLAAPDLSEAISLVEAAANSDAVALEEIAPWVDDAYEWLAWCEYNQSLVKNEDDFFKLRKHNPPFDTIACFSWERNGAAKTPEVPQGIRNAIEHFKQAAWIRQRPNTFVDWATALSISDWNQFQRRIHVYYLEDPDEFADEFDSLGRLDPFCERGSYSALCLYDRALEIFPTYGSAHQGRAFLFEYAADYQVYEMTEDCDWKRATNAVEIGKCKKEVREKQADLDKLKAELKPIVEEAERLGELRRTDFHSWKIGQLNLSAGELQTKIDRAEQAVKDAKKKLETRSKEVDLPTIKKLQTALLGNIKVLTKQCLEDYNSAATEGPEALEIPVDRDRAAVVLMELNPTGFYPISETGASAPSYSAKAAMGWAENSAKSDDYSDLYELATLAAALNATGSFKEAVRREKSAWGKMNQDEQAAARDYYELYLDNKSKITAGPE